MLDMDILQELLLILERQCPGCESKKHSYLLILTIEKRSVWLNCSLSSHYQI